MKLGNSIERLYKMMNQMNSIIDTAFPGKQKKATRLDGFSLG
jgi:hypothetical protein